MARRRNSMGASYGFGGGYPKYSWPSAGPTIQTQWPNNGAGMGDRGTSAPGDTMRPTPGGGVNQGFYPTIDQARPKWNAGDDPGYQRVASQIAAQRDADAANRRSNIQQALIAFGMVPGDFSDKYGDIDPATRGLIDKNTNTGISQYARLLGAKQDAKTALLNRIGAKGLFRSGAKGKGLRRGQLDYDRSLADSMAQLMQNLGGFSSSYANNELSRQQALENAMAAAYQNYNPPIMGPQYDPSTYAQFNRAAPTLAYYGGRAGQSTAILRGPRG